MDYLHTVTFANLTATDTSDIRAIGGSNTTGTVTWGGQINVGAMAPSGTGSSLQVTAASGGTVDFINAITDGSNTSAITKTGAGTVKFSCAPGNTYDGGTTVSTGTLLVTNTSGSGTGTGAVNVTAGTLGGTGSVSGAVTVGNGAGGSDSFIAPGSGGIGTFTTTNSLSLASDATFSFEFNSSAITADKLVANGVTLNGSSVFSYTDLGSGTLALNTVFTIIDNTSGSAISGAFGNLADLSTFTVGANQFQASYSGGTGNDLVITVVPEPATWALLAFSLTTVMVLHRRKA
jgi:autotransporter-associated beta strand protein